MELFVDVLIWGLGGKEKSGIIAGILVWVTGWLVESSLN